VVGAADQDEVVSGVTIDFQRPRRHHHERHAGRMAQRMIDEIALPPLPWSAMLSCRIF